MRAFYRVALLSLVCYVLLCLSSVTRCNGETKIYNFTVGSQYLNPDGFWRPVIMINNQFPGPLINVTVGDTLIVRLVNKLPASVITLHWHGLTMKDAPHMDGAAHVTQYPVTPMQEFEYKFVVHEFGTYWYHAHLPLQYCDGLLGPLIIQRPNDPLRQLYDEEKVIIVQDWFHAPGSELATPRPLKNHFLPYLLVNGLGRTNCSDEREHNFCDPNKTLSVVNVNPGTRYRLRIISAGTRVGISFSISHHTMRVVEVQGMTVVPFDTNELHLTMGSRFDVILIPNQPADNYWIRTKVIGCDACSPDKSYNLQPNLGWTNYAILRYSGAPQTEPTIPFTLASPSNVDPPLSPVVWHDIRLKALNAPRVPQTANVLQVMNLSSEVITIPEDTVATRRFWYTNGKLFHAGHVPFLLRAAQQDKFEHDPLVFTFPHNAVIDVVYNSLHNQDHPIHLHGYKFWYLGSGPGAYDTRTAAPYLNLVDPPLLDTIVIEAYTWVMFRFVADNPGAWLIHCHLDFHHAEEMAALFVVAPEKLKAYPPPNFPICDSYPNFYTRQSLPTTPTPSPTPTPGDGDDGDNKMSEAVKWALIIGGGVVGIAIIGAVAFFFIHRSQQNEEGTYLMMK